MSDTKPLKVAYGYVVWDPDASEVRATDEGCFVWDRREDAWAHCRKGEKDRPARVEVIIGGE